MNAFTLGALKGRVMRTRSKQPFRGGRQLLMPHHMVLLSSLNTNYDWQRAVCGDLSIWTRRFVGLGFSLRLLTSWPLIFRPAERRPLRGPELLEHRVGGAAQVRPCIGLQVLHRNLKRTTRQVGAGAHSGSGEQAITPAAGVTLGLDSDF